MMVEEAEEGWGCLMNINSLILDIANHLSECKHFKRSTALSYDGLPESTCRVSMTTAMRLRLMSS